MNSLSLSEAAEELLKRRTIRRSLTSWVQHCGFQPARHHQLLLKELEAISDGSNDRLMVFMPPGSAKSTYGSMLFPPWYMSQHPDHMVIAASHTHELAARWGRKCRNLVSEYSNGLGIALAEGDSAADRWSLAAGGEYFAAGVGGSVTGRRADLVVIDDPVRSREDADSETIREKTADWYRSDLLTRLKPGGRVVIIQTRWHEDDLSGRLLDAMRKGGDQWRVISLPALAGMDDPLGREPGDALWPEWEDADALKRKRAALLPREWSALYQQNPVPEDGDYFKTDWIKRYEVAPKDLRIVGGSDYAVTSDGGDYTVHLVVGMDTERRPYVLDMWRGQTSSDVWVDAWCDLVTQWKPIEWGEEKGQINAGVGPFLVRRAIERKAYTYRRGFASRTDKAIRAQSIRGRMAQLGLYVPTDRPWASDLISELLQFPAGKHDDQVDALSLIGQLLDHIDAGFSRVKPEERPTELQYEVQPDGRIVANMSIMDIVAAKKRKRDAA
jgi:predicted phage terminase large subunit-like protein